MLYWLCCLCQWHAFCLLRGQLFWLAAKMWVGFRWHVHHDTPPTVQCLYFCRFRRRFSICFSQVGHKFCSCPTEEVLLGSELHALLDGTPNRLIVQDIAITRARQSGPVDYPENIVVEQTTENLEDQYVRKVWCVHMYEVHMDVWISYLLM